MAIDGDAGPSSSNSRTAPSTMLPPGLALSIANVLDGSNGPQHETPSSSSSSSSSLTAELARQFHSPETLSSTSIQRIQARMRADLGVLDDEIDGLIDEVQRQQSSSKLAPAGEIQAQVRDLFERLETIRTKATSSEKTVKEITGDIRSLDTAKNNLVASMTMLRRLQMLESGATQLQTLTEERKLKEAAQSLDAAKALQTSFKTFMAVERVAATSRRIAEAQQRLKTAAMEEYEKFFLQEAGSSKSITTTQVPDAALAVDAIGIEAINALLDWYCTLQLREYRRIFRATDEAGQLDNVSRRFAWFRRVLKQHDEEHADGFLEKWHAARALTARFADITRDDLKSALIRERPKLQVNTLLEALQATIEYEAQASKRFGGIPFSQIYASNPRPVTAAGPSGITIAPTAGAAAAENISSVFEPYLGLFVEAQDKALAELMTNYRRQGTNLPAGGGAGGPGAAGGPEGATSPGSHPTVLPSSTELFYFYRQSLEQCSRLSNREAFRDLIVVFRRYLRAYGEDVLRAALLQPPRPEAGRRSTSSSTDTRTSVQDLQRWCLVLNTADYCANTCTQLESRLKAKIHADFKEQVTLEPDRDVFEAIVAAAVQVLTREAEMAVEPAVPHKMMRGGGGGSLGGSTMPSGLDMSGSGSAGGGPQAWASLTQVQGKSQYVDEVRSNLESVAVVVRQDVENKRYVRSWCDKTVQVVLAKWTHCLVRLLLQRVHQQQPSASSPPTSLGRSRSAMEQLLVDLYEIKATLLELPQHSPSEQGSVSAQGYARHVERSVARVEALLRLLLVPLGEGEQQVAPGSMPEEAFLAEYVRLCSAEVAPIAGQNSGLSSLSNLQKAIDLKCGNASGGGTAGARLSDALVDRFFALVDEAAREDGAKKAGDGAAGPTPMGLASLLSTLEMDPPPMGAMLTAPPSLEFAPLNLPQGGSFGAPEGAASNSYPNGGTAAVTSDVGGLRSPTLGDGSASSGGGLGVGARSVFGGAGGKFGSLFGLGLVGDRRG